MGRESRPHEVEITVVPPPGRFDSVTAGAPSPPSPRQPNREWATWLVPAIIFANVAMFFVTMYVNNCPKKSSSGKCLGSTFLGRFSFQQLKENPLVGPSPTTLEKMGALDVEAVVHQHQGWRLITCIWLHAGVVHILVNMLSVLFIGLRLEEEFGFVRVGLLYIISGLGGSLLSALFSRSIISVGASGALFGLLGAMLSELITNWSIYVNKFAALSILIIIITINLAVGLLPHVDNFAHIGGFISGFLLGFVLLIRPQFGWVNQKHAGYTTGVVKRKHKLYQYILCIIAGILLIFGFAVGFVMLLRGVDANDHCLWCHHLSCVPTSKWSCRSMQCLSSQDLKQLNLTCVDNERFRIYPLANATQEQMMNLCIDLCG